MRILFFSNVYPNPINPTKGTFNLSLARGLAREHAVHVVSPISWIDELAARLRGFKGSVATTPETGRLTVEYPRYYYPPKFARSHYGAFLAWSVRDALDRSLRTFRPDAVVSYWAHPDGEVAVRAARAAGIPAVVMVGGSDVLLLARRGARRTSILKVLRGADAVVAVSRDIATKLRGDGVDPARIHVIHRGVDRRQFSPGDRTACQRRLEVLPDRKILVAVGRLVPVKGFDVLIAACRRLVDCNVPIACYVLGDGPLKESLAAQIRRLQLENHVFLQGAVKQQMLPDWYRAADLTVLSSHSEGIPNVLLESICCGTPFVATRVGGVPEIADSRIHELVPPDDDAALAGAIARRLRPTSGGSVTPSFVPDSWEASAERLCEVIEQCRRSEDSDHKGLREQIDREQLAFN